MIHMTGVRPVRPRCVRGASGRTEPVLRPGGASNASEGQTESGSGTHLPDAPTGAAK